LFVDAKVLLLKRGVMMLNAQAQPQSAVAPQDFSTGLLHGHETAPLAVGNSMYIVTPYPPDSIRKLVAHVRMPGRP
jgi:hypothetical protein